MRLMYASEERGEYFSRKANVFRNEVEGNIQTQGKTKLTVYLGKMHQGFCHIAIRNTIEKQTIFTR